MTAAATPPMAAAPSSQPARPLSSVPEPEPVEGRVIVSSVASQEPSKHAVPSAQRAFGSSLAVQHSLTEQVPSQQSSSVAQSRSSAQSGPAVGPPHVRLVSSQVWRPQQASSASQPSPSPAHSGAAAQTLSKLQ